MIDSHLSRGCFFWQAIHNSRPVVLLLSGMLTYVLNLFLLCLEFCCEPFDGLSKYWSIADFENRRVIYQHLPLICLCLLLNSCLAYLSLVWQGSLASNMHMTSVVSSWFHCADFVILWHFCMNLYNLWYPSATAHLVIGQALISFLYSTMTWRAIFLH